MRSWWRWLLALVLLFGAGIWVWFELDMQRARDRIAQRSAIVPWAGGSIEYTEDGKGLPVLVIHGSGGGFDQGMLIAQAVLGEQVHWMAPSRMGYLRSTLPAGASFETQADAYVALLDAMGLRRVGVVAMSQGGPSALFLAARHPERVSSLVLISCGVASSNSDPHQADANAKGDALVKAFRHDFGYWLASTFFRSALLSLMGVDAQVVEGMSAAQRALARRVIEEMNPVAPRADGVSLDNRARMPNDVVRTIRAPTLIFHARDDGLQLFRNAEYAAQWIPGAELRAYDSGGHLLLIVQQAAIREQTLAFVQKHAIH